jgi:hypothetical protein
MNRGQRQVIAEKVSSSVRILELLEMDYTVRTSKRGGKKQPQSPRVIEVSFKRKLSLRIYNNFRGNTWVHKANGSPLPKIKSIESLYNYLAKIRKRRRS